MQPPGPPGATTLALQAAAHSTFAGMYDDDSDPVPLLKQLLARAIVDHLGEAGQFALARRLGIDQPRASNLERGRLERFSLQQLVRFVARGDGEVTLTVQWRRRTRWVIPRQPRRRDPHGRQAP